MNNEPNTNCPECDTELVIVDQDTAECLGCGYTETYGSAHNNH